MSAKIPQLLIDELTRRNVITQDFVLEISGEMASGDQDFGEILLQKGIITDEDLVALKSQIYNLPTIRAPDVEIDPNLSEKVSDATVKLYKILPYAISGDHLKVILVDPENFDALQALKFIASEQSLTLEKNLVTYQDFGILSSHFLSLTSEVGEALETISEEKKQKEIEVSEKETKLEEITAEAPVTKIVAAIIKHAVDTRASDIHVEAFKDLIRLRFRVDGVLQTALSLPGNLLSALSARIKILSELKIDETRLAQDGRFSTKFKDRIVDFRVSTFPTYHGEKIVMRILDPLVGNLELADLGFEKRTLDILDRNISKPFGSILITGPTGSGKSTTLAAILRKMNSDQINIVTLEDPIEHYVEGVNQSQVHDEIGYTFANGLRHILRQDPDVIMVGEIRDKETANLATQAALTGHVVISTLHTNNSIGVIPRLIDMGVERYLIAPSLNLAAAQRLLRKLCESCKVETKADKGEEKYISDALNAMPKELSQNFGPPFKLFKAGKGCKECGNRVYKGRVAIFEVLEMTDELERIILTDLSEENLRAEAKRQQMVTIFQDGIIKVLNGVTSFEELLQVAQSSEES